MSRSRILIASLLWGFFAISLSRAGDSKVVNPPKQEALSSTQIAWGVATLEVKATYQASVLIFRTQAYQDPVADVCPLDIAVGWGDFLNRHHAEKLHVTQSNRHYRWMYWGSKWKPEEIHQQSANLHIIPATESICNSLEQLKPYQVVHLEGKLVDVAHPSLTETWKSSLTRNDTGTGACEILLLEKMELLNVE